MGLSKGARVGLSMGLGWEAEHEARVGLSMGLGWD